MKSFLLTGFIATSFICLVPDAQAQLLQYGRSRSTFDQPFGREYREYNNIDFGGAEQRSDGMWEIDSRKSIKSLFD